MTIGLDLGPKRFDRWVRRFGFGEPTGVGLPGEAGGIVPRPEDYSGSSLGNLPIGQGLAVTPLQMVAGYSAIANNGVLHPPHVIAGEDEDARRVLSAGTANEVARMLEGVLAAGGTAAEASVPGYVLAGKTGTAEKPDLGARRPSPRPGCAIGGRRSAMSSRHPRQGPSAPAHCPG